MSKIVSAVPIVLVSLFWTALAFAAEAGGTAEEPPLQDNTVGIVAFVVITVVCFAVFGWYLWKNEKKGDQDKTGEKF